MAEVSLHDLPKTGALMGIDPGTKTLGVAVSDTTRLIASPLDTIPRGKKLRPALDRLFTLYDDRRCVGIVCGLPLNMDGTSGPRTQAVRGLIYNLCQIRDVPVAFRDERLSTAGVERLLIDADQTRKRRGEVVDKMAAAWILQSAIDQLAEG